MPRKIKRYRKTDSASVAAVRQSRVQAGLDRERFFAENGDPKQWTFSRKVAVNQKKRKDKMRCRGTVRSEDC